MSSRRKEKKIGVKPELRSVIDILITHMMFAFGDNERPLADSVDLVYSILCRQMKALMWKASKTARERESHKITHEDILFLLRRDTQKLRRLLKYLDVKRFKSQILDSLNFTLNAAKYAAEQINEKVGPPKVTGLHRCMKFLEKLDDCGELSSILETDPYDEVREERAARQDLRTRFMNLQQYKMYAEARAATFGGRKLGKFNAWLKAINESGLRCTSFAAELLGNLAYETVAQIVDLALLVKQECMTYQLARVQPDSLHNSTSLEAFFHSTQYGASSISGQHDEASSWKCIQPWEILEAYNRYLQPSGPFNLFSRAHEVSTEDKFFSA